MTKMSVARKAKKKPGLAPPPQPVAEPKPGLKIDIGCGSRKQAGFLGVDQIAFPGVDVIHDIRVLPWPWSDGEVEEVHCSHFLEHLSGVERVDFFNELYRVLKPGGKATLIVPHWASGRAYGDPTHQWPPVVEMFWYYLDANWRNGDAAKNVPGNAPHVPLHCHFLSAWGYAIAPLWQVKSQEAQQFAINHYREVATDMMATITKLEMPVPAAASSV